MLWPRLCVEQTQMWVSNIFLEGTQQWRYFIQWLSLPFRSLWTWSVWQLKQCLELAVGNHISLAVLLCNLFHYQWLEAWLLLGQSVLEVAFSTAIMLIITTVLYLVQAHTKLYQNHNGFVILFVQRKSKVYSTERDVVHSHQKQPYLLGLEPQGWKAIWQMWHTWSSAEGGWPCEWP